MEVPGGSDNKFTVCLYEMIGTFILIYTIIISGGQAYAVTCILLIAIIYTGPISGAHLNPGVSTAVYIMQGKYKDNLKLYILIQVFQYLGGFLAMFLGYLTLMPSFVVGDAKSDAKIPISWIPVQCPVDIENPLNPCDESLDRGRSAMISQIILSTFFFFLICMIKSDSAQPTKDGLLQGAMVVVALFGAINASDHVGGPCYNPAVGVVTAVFAKWQDAHVNEV